MMSETVVTMDGSSNNASNNRRQVPTVKSEPGQPNPLSGIRLNPLYFKTLPGIVKLVQLVIGIICMVCATPATTSGTAWFLFVVTIAFIATALWCFVYLLSLREALNLPINWILTELLNTGILTALYTITFILHLSTSIAWSPPGHTASNIIAGIFGIVNTLAYAAGTYFLWIEWKNSTMQ